ncbi:hypothetical protein ACET3Z_007004 [Daucus carota]
MSEPDLQINKVEMVEPCVWFKTADGSVHEVEKEVASFCPSICHEIDTGVGHSRNYPIALPPRVNPAMLSLIFDYCRFHHIPGRSNKERRCFDEKFSRMDTKRLCELTSAADSLHFKSLVDLTSRALARMIEGKTPDEIRETFHLPDDLTEEEKLEPLKNTTDDPRIRLLNRLYARKRKELINRQKLKNTEAEIEHEDDRSVEDLLSFINEKDGDSKVVTGSKNKKRNRKRKNQQKNPPPSCSSSNGNPSSNTGNKIQNKVLNGSHGTRDSVMDRDDFLSAFCETLRLHSMGDDKLTLEEEFDDCDVDDELDPALKEKLDREVEDFARRLNSDWPERMQEILSSGQESRPGPVSSTEINPSEIDHDHT